MKIGEKEYIVTDLGTLKNEVIERLKTTKYSDLEDMVFRFELSSTEILKRLDMKYIDASTTGYTLPPGVYEVSDIIFLIKSLLPDDVKVNITFDDIRMRSNLLNNNSIKFTGKSFFYNTRV